MTPRRRQRMIVVCAVLAGVTIAALLALRAFDEDILYFYDPSQVVAGEPPTDRMFRVGGMVSEGTVVRAAGSMTVDFMVTDFQHNVPVRYTGVLPDLFREGQGVIAHGRLDEQGVFVAREVLAKHDENYMPPEVAESLKEKHPESPPLTETH